LSDTFKPIINGAKKKLLIKSKTGLKFSTNLNWDVDLEVETPTFSGDEDLTVRSFRAKTTTFNNTKKLAAKDSIHIETKDFTNISGRLETHGDVQIKADGQFRNTGGGTLEKGTHGSTYYVASGAGYLECKFPPRDIYKPDLGKAGVITAGRFLDITAGRFDNSFGILNASQKMQIKSLEEVCNECGLIHSGGPTTITGTRLKNGYMRGAETVPGVDPSQSIQQTFSVTKYRWGITGGYTRHNGTWPFGSDEWVNTWGNIPYQDSETKVVGYHSKQYSESVSKYPGYIFPGGNLDIQMDSETYLGTIVSGGDIKIKGAKQESINVEDRGLLIARGDIKAELQKAALSQLALQAQNIYMNLVDDLVIRGIVQPILMPDGSVSQLINLQQFGKQLGFLTDGLTFAEQGASFPSPTGLIPLSLSSSSSSGSSSFSGSGSTFDFSVHPTAEAGFLGSKPSAKFFMPTVQDSILNQLITLTLTPIYGRNILLNIDLIGQLMRRGSAVAETFRGMQSLTLPEGDPAILFEKSSNPDIEVEIDGEKIMVPLYDSFLLTDLVSRLLNKIQAEKLLSFQSLGNIRLEPGQINLESPILIMEAQKQMQVASEFQYSDDGRRVGVNPIVLPVSETLIMSGKTGVETRGFFPSAKTIEVSSSDGSIVDAEMRLDPVYTFHGGGKVSMQQQTATSAFRASYSMSFSAPCGSIDQHGTDLIAGPGGITFDAQKQVWQPAFEENEFFAIRDSSFAHVWSKNPKVGGMQTPGSVIFRSKDTSMVGAQIVAGTISNPIDGVFRTLPAYSSHKYHSYTTKSSFWGGRSSQEVEETRELVEPTRLIADHFESLGVGTCEMESTIVKALDATITKNLVEKTAYDRIHFPLVGDKPCTLVRIASAQ
jgi:adhesin HecA-like repeat protein